MTGLEFRQPDSAGFLCGPEDIEIPDDDDVSTGESVTVQENGEFLKESAFWMLVKLLIQLSLIQQGRVLLTLFPYLTA